jgi:CRP-like cAMP-binding protein
MAAVDRSLVAKFPLFKEFHAEALDAILSEARCDRYPKNTAVFQQGEQAASFFVLLHGHVRASKATPAGDQIVVRYVSPGEIFGVTTAIGLDHYPATATAVDDSVVLSWPSAKWPSLVAQHPSLAVSTLQMVGSRLQETHKRVVEMSTEQVEQRIAHALLRLAKQAGRKVEGGIKIDFPISRQDVAEMTGTTLHTVSRTLSAWEQQGLVESARQSIVLRDPHRLFIIAERGQAGGDTVKHDDANAPGGSTNTSPRRG